MIFCSAAELIARYENEIAKPLASVSKILDDAKDVIEKTDVKLSSPLSSPPPSRKVQKTDV